MKKTIIFLCLLIFWQVAIFILFSFVDFGAILGYSTFIPWLLSFLTSSLLLANDKWDHGLSLLLLLLCLSLSYSLLYYLGFGRGVEAPIWPYVGGLAALLGSAAVARALSLELRSSASISTGNLTGVTAESMNKNHGEHRDIKNELDRARRFEYQVAIIACRLEDPNIEEMPDLEGVKGSSQKIQRPIYDPHWLAEKARAVVEVADIVTLHQSAVLICLPQTNKVQTNAFLYRLAKNLPGLLAVGCAFFPEDGLILEDLLDRALSRITPWSDHPSSVDIYEQVPNGTTLVDMERRLEIDEKLTWLRRLPVPDAAAHNNYMQLKPVMDVMLVLFSAPLLLVIMAFCGLLIYLGDKGPIFFTQERTGLGGRRFRMIKFRTMHVDAQAESPQTIDLKSGQVITIWPEKSLEDQRIHRTGRFLRRTSFDELPQVFNVLAGQMSLVGPRPTSWDLDMYTLYQTARLAVRPGMTGLWQIYARRVRNLDEWLIWDQIYIQKMSFRLDAQILFRTVGQVLKLEGK